MLYLKLAHLHGEVAAAKREASASFSDLEISDQFKTIVIHKSAKLRQDIQVR